MPVLPPSAVSRLGAPAVRSRALFHFEARRLSLTATSGQVGTLTRAATLTATDSGGTTYTAPHSMPVWIGLDWDGDTVRESVGLRLGTSDRLSFPIGWLPQSLSFLCEFVETGSPGAMTFGISSETPGAGKPYVLVVYNISPDGYALFHNNGTTQGGSLVGATTAIGDRVRLRGVLNADGSGQIWQSRNGAAETTGGTFGAHAFASAWASDTRIRIGTLPSLANGAGSFRSLIILPGVRTLAELQEAL